MLKSLFGVTKTAVAPVSVAADLTRVVTKPIVDATLVITEETRTMLKDD